MRDDSEFIWQIFPKKSQRFQTTPLNVVSFIDVCSSVHSR